MGKQKTLVPWFQRGLTLVGMTYSITNNIVNYLIVIATLSGVLGVAGQNCIRVCDPGNVYRTAL